VAASVSRDRVLVPTGEDDADGEIEVEEVDLEPRPRTGVPKTMRELAESYAQRQEEATPPPPREEEGDLAMTESEGQRERVVGEGSSRRGGEGPGRRTTKRRPVTRTTRTSRKRQRRQSESEGASDVDGEEVHRTPPKRRQLEASVSPVSVSSLASTPNPNPGSGRVLRPRPQKSATKLREERVMEEAYRRAVAG
jgi:xeroderma pigmentosum group C-complementing protein